MLKQIPVQGHVLTYREHSKGDEIFIFLHGWSSFQFVWSPILKYFTYLGKCITVDLPGHAPAEVPPNFQSIEVEELIHIQAEAISKISKGKKITLIGHSAGGFVTLGIASLYPHLLKRIIAICPGSHGPVGGFLYPVKLGYERLGSLMPFLQKAIMTPAFSMELFFRGAVYSQTDFFARPDIQEFLKEYHERFQSLDPRLMGIFLTMFDKCEIRPMLKDVHCPTLVIVGKHDLIIPAYQGAEIARLIDGARFIAMEQSGHIPFLEEKEETVSHMLDWLEETNDIQKEYSKLALK